jgi:hypothetical protein
VDSLVDARLRPHTKPFSRGAQRASISEPDRAKLFIALTSSLGESEAQTLSSALNIDNQLATRDELRTEIMSVREAMREFEHRVELNLVRLESRIDTRFTTFEAKLNSTTRTLVFQLLGLQLSASGLFVAIAKFL